MGICRSAGGQLTVQVNSAVVIAASKLPTSRCRPRKSSVQTQKFKKRSDVGKMITPELARTASEQIAVLDAMDVLTSLRDTVGSFRTSSGNTRAAVEGTARTPRARARNDNDDECYTP
jgi:hypothetical protein